MDTRHRNAFVSPGLRLVNLYTFICSSGKPHSLGRLAELFRCSRQTILRLMEQMLCIPEVRLETWRDGRTRYYQVRPSEIPDGISLSDTTIRHLLLCQDIVRHLLPTTLPKELGQAESTEIPSSGQLAEPWVKGRIDYTPFQSILESVQTAMREKVLCHVQYDSRSTGTQNTLLVAPLRIIAFHEALYIRCREYSAPKQPTDQYRTMAVHRIKKFRRSSQIFLEEEKNEGNAHFGFPFHEPIKVKVAFWRGAATYVQERTWSPGQKIKKRRDGGVELTFTTTSRQETLRWVLSFGQDAELLEPSDLRAVLNTEVVAIQTRYATQAQIIRPAKKTGKTVQISGTTQ